MPYFILKTPNRRLGLYSEFLLKNGASAHLIRNWKMPNDVAAAVAVHHNAHEAEKLGGNICAIACLLATGRHLRYGENEAWLHWRNLVEKTLKIGSEELAEILSTTEAAAASG